MVLYDRARAEREFTPGVYLTDEQTLWRILDFPEEQQQRKGELPLEDCHFPEAPPVWRPIAWLTRHKARVVRR